eukprot:1031997-Rhodomonas_salina.1
MHAASFPSAPMCAPRHLQRKVSTRAARAEEREHPKCNVYVVRAPFSQEKMIQRLPTQHLRDANDAFQRPSQPGSSKAPKHTR